jgi:hypothetical protein
MIRDYLIDTRLLSRGQLNDATRARYAPMVSFCESIRARGAGGDDKKAHVVVTYSAQRKCELVELNTAQHLIYDRNLGQSLNNLNRIMFFGDKSVSGLRPLVRIMADEAILLGSHALALFFIGNEMRHNDAWTLPAAASRLDILTQTILQELFIIAHEYCHLIASLNPDFRASRARIGKLLWEPDDKPISGVKIRNRILKRYSEAASAKELERDAIETRHFLKLNEVSLVDELSCDDFALNVLQAWCRKNRIPLREAFKAAFLVLRHVRSINYIRTFVRQLATNKEPTGIDDRVRLLQQREHRLRQAFPFIVGIMKASKENKESIENLSAETLHAEISDLSDLQDERIDKVFLFELFSELPYQFSKWNKRCKVVTSKLPTLTEIASLRGWSYDVDDFTFVTFPQG